MNSTRTPQALPSVSLCKTAIEEHLHRLHRSGADSIHDEVFAPSTIRATLEAWAHFLEGCHEDQMICGESFLAA